MRSGPPLWPSLRGSRLTGVEETLEKEEGHLQCRKEVGAREETIIDHIYIYMNIYIGINHNYDYNEENLE